MRYNTLGDTGLLVSELCLGTMTFGGDEGLWGQIGKLQQAEATALVKAAIDAGINVLDTANIYAEGRSETITGQALKDLGVARADVVIATKVFGRVGPGPNGTGASRHHILAEAEKSLKRLGVDHIDLYQIHGFDATTPIEETLSALDDLVRRGLVRYAGVSNWAAWQVAKGVGIAARRGYAPIASLQAYYSLAGRDLEREIVPMLASEKVGLLVWSPLAGGFLSGKYDRSGATAEGRRATFDFPPVDKEKGHAIVEAIRPIAAARGVSVARVALAWLLHKPVVTSVIVGAKTVDQLADNLAAVDVRLDAAEIAALDAVSALSPEYPGWMLERQGGYRQGLATQNLRR